MRRLIIIIISLFILLILFLFVDVQKDYREVKDTTGLVAISVCVTDAEAVILDGKKAVKLQLSYIDLWGEERKEVFAVYDYSPDQFPKGDSITMYQDPLKPGTLKYKKNFE